MQKTKKRVADSRTEQVHILMPADSNGSYRLFGGILMQWIDIVAGVVARRHSGLNVTTAAVDSLQFLAPAHINDTVTLIGKITFVGHTSMEVCVETFVEELTGKRTLVNRAYMVMVAVDEHERPCEAPGLILETDEEREEWDRAKQRLNQRKANRQKEKA